MFGLSCVDLLETVLRVDINHVDLTLRLNLIMCEFLYLLSQRLDELLTWGRACALMQDLAFRPHHNPSMSLLPVRQCFFQLRWLKTRPLQNLTSPHMTLFHMNPSII